MPKANAFEPSSGDDDDGDEPRDVVEETMRYLLLHGGTVADDTAESDTHDPTAKLLLSTSRKILAWCSPGSQAEEQHLEFICLATQQSSVDNVIQSFRFSSFRCSIIQAMLRTFSMIAACQLVADKDAPTLFVDAEGRSLADVLVLAAVIIAVNSECVVENGGMSSEIIDDLMWVVRWLSGLAARTADRHLSSLSVVFCVLLYCYSLPAHDFCARRRESQHGLRRLLARHCELFTCRADFLSTLEDMHAGFIPDAVIHLRRAVAELSHSNVSGTISCGKVVGHCFRLFRAAVSPFVAFIDELCQKEAAIRHFIAVEWLTASNALQHAKKAEQKLLVFNQLWFDAFRSLFADEVAHRGVIAADSLLVPQVIASKKAAMELLWQDTLWDTFAIGQRETATRRNLEGDALRQLKAMLGAFRIEIATSVSLRSLLDPAVTPTGAQDQSSRAASPDTHWHEGSDEQTELLQHDNQSCLSEQEERRADNQSCLSERSQEAADDEFLRPLDGDDAAATSPPPLLCSLQDQQHEEIIEREILSMREQDEFNSLTSLFESERWVRYYWTISGDRKPIGTRRVLATEWITGKCSDRHLPAFMRTSAQAVTARTAVPSMVTPPRPPSIAPVGSPFQLRRSQR
jgi:hypothetical protein